MKNILKTTLVAFFLVHCTTQVSPQNKDKTFGFPQKTANPNTPYIYINGFKDYQISQSIITIQSDTLQVNELKFNAVFSAMYTKKVMFENFGKWTKEIRPNNESHPILMWEKIKLFEHDEKLFTIFANGDESKEGIYASVLAFDQYGNGCLSDKSRYKEKIIDYFSNAIRNQKNSDSFYNIYWKSVNKYDAERSAKK